MPKLNEIKFGGDIGKKPVFVKFIWTACESCSKPRWVQYLVREDRPKRRLCRHCVLVSRKGEKRGPAHNRLNLIGQKFTRLTVLRDVGNSTKRESLWECQCDCGNTTKVPAFDLRSGNTKSCGCYHKDRTRELFSFSDEDLTIGRVLGNYQKSAKIKGHSFCLSREEVAKLIFMECHYCGAKPGNQLVTGTGRPTLFYQGIDRKDNSLGYTSENSLPCCIVCNKMKKVMNHEDFLMHIYAIASRFMTESPQSIYNDPWMGDTTNYTLQDGEPV